VVIRQVSQTLDALRHSFGFVDLSGDELWFDEIKYEILI
jgi:hypothetical protein